MDVTVGQELPVFEREAGFPAWNRYAAVNDEFIPIHMDDEAGQAAGYPGAFGMGNLQWAWLHCMLRDWIAGHEPTHQQTGVTSRRDTTHTDAGSQGGRGRIVSLACQFRGPSLKGHTVSAHGVVTGVRDEGDERFVDLEVWTQVEDGTRLAPGTATVAFSP
jgi:acyl dehydratase